MENALSSPIRVDVPVITLDPTQRQDVRRIPDPKAAGELEAVADRDERQRFRAVLEEGVSQLDTVQSAILRRRFYGKQTRQQTATALHITPADVRREEAKALQVLRHNRRIWALEGAAYQGTGYRRDSVEERLLERFGTS